MQAIDHNLAQIRSKIARAARRSGREPQAITLVAVSKMVDTLAIRRAYDLGVMDFGENRVQELLRKMNNLPQARWHMIGRLQTNKVKDIVGKTFLIHSLDRWSLAEEIDRRGSSLGMLVPVLVQVNVSREPSKTGLLLEEVSDFLTDIGRLGAVKVQGLMTMAPEGADAEASRPVFRQLADLRRHWQGPTGNVDLKYLSMGMSQDYEVAIEEGANLVRIGSALFT